MERERQAFCNVNEVGSGWHFQHNTSQLDVGNMYALLRTTCHVPGFLMGHRRRSPKRKATIGGGKIVSVKLSLAKSSSTQVESPNENAFWKVLRRIAMVAQALHQCPLFWRKFYRCPTSSLMKKCYKSSQRQQEVLKLAPSNGYCHQKKKKKKKSLCSPNEVFQKWITITCQEEN